MIQAFNSQINEIRSWSARLKNFGMKVTEQTVKKAQEYGWTCCLGNWQMNDQSTQPYRWSIKLLNSFSFGSTWLGINSEESAVNRNFKGWNWSNLNHGAYIIHSSGRVFSSSDAKVNGKWDCFMFGEGDTIKIEYDPTTGKLFFKKYNLSYQMTVDTKLKFRASVHMYSCGQSAEIGDW